MTRKAVGDFNFSAIASNGYTGDFFSDSGTGLDPTREKNTEKKTVVFHAISKALRDILLPISSAIVLHIFLCQVSGPYILRVLHTVLTPGILRAALLVMYRHGNEHVY